MGRRRSGRGADVVSAPTGDQPPDACPAGGAADVEIDVQTIAGTWPDDLVAATVRAARFALAGRLPARQGGWELAVTLADDRHLWRLNRYHRGRDRPTNVLSFPQLADPAGPAATAGRIAAAARAGAPLPQPLGDLALADGVIAREAAAGGLAPDAHLSHLVIHGVLHLLGYDHAGQEEALPMEATERELLARLGFADPDRRPAGAPSPPEAAPAGVPGRDRQDPDSDDRHDQRAWRDP